MKKVIIGFCCLLFTVTVDCYSQSVSGKVIYKTQLAGYGSGNKNSKFLALNEAIIKIANKQTLTLNFNSGQSSSVLDKYLISDADDNEFNKMARSLAFVVTNGNDYFFEKSTNTAVERKDNGSLTKKTHKKLEWDITTESKMIGDYLCYKAIYLDKFINRLGKNTSVPITAWFAPSLPYGFGPKYFNGLPGLILELEDRETTFLASSIIISNESEATIDFPKGKTITKEEFEKKMKSQYGS